VKSILANNFRENNEVFVEPTLKVGGNLVKSHLVIKTRESILVVDVTVRYENKDHLHKAVPKSSERKV
jgi:glycine cleavage system regulatory protein